MILVKKLLTLNPDNRISAKDALEYFDDIRDNIDIKHPSPILYVSRCEEILDLRSYPNGKRISSSISGNSRKILMEWLDEVRDEYILSYKSLYLAIKMIDMYVSQSENDESLLSNYQLIGCTFLSLASEFFDLSPPSNSDMVYISDDTFTSDQILNTRKCMWKKFTYNLMYSTIYDYLNLYTSNISDLKEETYNSYIKNLLKLTINPQITGEIPNILSHASDKELAIGLILATNTKLNLNEPKDCFRITSNSYSIADKIFEII